MIRGAIWWLEQWNNIHSPLYRPFGDAILSEDSELSDSRKLAGFTSGLLYAGMTGLAPAIVIGSSPYLYMSKAGGSLSEGWRTAMRVEGGLLAHTTPVSRWILGGSDDVFRLVRSRLFLAKVGARFIPGLGWGLLAYDLYTVGKWYMETDF
ncbi:MAG TPA: hypothetical protein EYN51_01555 [Flavobacteriales bacterium]|nr:hypothetical protein [Flavobacteriales bacterium]